MSYGTYAAEITAFDRDGGTVKLKDRLGKMRLYAGDRYYLRGSPDLISRPGEWAVRESNGVARVHYYPHDVNDLKAMDASAVTSESVVTLRGANHVVLEGLEVCCGGGIGILMSGCGDVTVRRCIVHDNRSTGISVSHCQRVRIAQNAVFRNHYGISMRRCHRVTIERNDIRTSGPAGISVIDDSRDILVQRNSVRGDL